MTRNHAVTDGDGSVPVGYWHGLDDGRIQCDLCPRFCRLREGQRGLCYVRQRLDDEVAEDAGSVTGGTRPSNADTFEHVNVEQAVVNPFVEFFSRDGIRGGLAILAFLFLFGLVPLMLAVVILLLGLFPRKRWI